MNAANTALSLDERDAVAYAALSMAGMFQKDFEACHDAAAMAIDINPNYAFAHLSLGMSLVFRGRVEEAMLEFDLLERLSPRDPMLWLAYNGRATACLTLGDHQAALSWTRKSIQHPHAALTSYLWHVVTLVQLGRIGEARAAAEEIMRIRPDFSLKVAEALPSGGAKLSSIYIDSLCQAGVPEE